MSDYQTEQIRQWFETWWLSKEGSRAHEDQKEIFWTAFRAGFIRCITDGSSDEFQAQRRLIQSGLRKHRQSLLKRLQVVGMDSRPATIVNLRSDLNSTEALIASMQ